MHQGFLDLFSNLLQSMGRYISVFIVFPLIISILSIRFIKETRKSKGINYIRLIILCIFLSVFWVEIWELLGNEMPFVSLELSGFESEDFSFYNFGLGLAVSLGLVLGAYLYRIESLYLTSIFAFFGLFVIFLYTGTSIFLMPFIYLCGIASLVVLFYTGVKLKDNGALGVALYFFIMFLTLFFDETGLMGIIDALITLTYSAFGIIFATGHFTPFKETGGNN